MQSGPTEGRRFGFWKKTLRVELVQRELFASEEGGGPVLDEDLASTCQALFRNVLLGNNGIGRGSPVSVPCTTTADFPLRRSIVSFSSSACSASGWVRRGVQWQAHAEPARTGGRNPP